MNEPRQAQFLKIGNDGCYFLSILHLAENFTGTYIDAYQAYLQAIRAKQLLENCFVRDPAALMHKLTDFDWVVIKQDLTYELMPGELEITRYEKNVSPTQTLTHFVVTDGRGKIIYDPMGGSPLDSSWKPISLRIFRRVA